MLLINIYPQEKVSSTNRSKISQIIYVLLLKFSNAIAMAKNAQ